jgi:hypothetical protein
MATWATWEDRHGALCREIHGGGLTYRQRFRGFRAAAYGVLHAFWWAL